MSPWRGIVGRLMTLSAAAVAGGGAACGLAQVQVQRAPQSVIGRGIAVNPEEFNAKDSNDGVYAPESTNAMDQLALAQKMERLQSWNNSADLYQEILTNPQYAAKVVPSREDENHRISQYTSVEELVMQRLSRWPQEGLDVYRARYEAPAATLLESAKGNDPFILQQVFARYFVTDAGRTAGIALMDHYLEAGEFRAAAAIGQRLLKWHPNVLAQRPAILYRTALAFHLSGDDADARARFNELHSRDPQAKGSVRGLDVVLADSLSQELKQAAPAVMGSTGDSYTTFGGDAARDRILAVSGMPGAHLYRVALSKPPRVDGPQGPTLDARYKQEVKGGMTLGVMPVVDQGQLFFQDGERLYALNLDSGVPLAGWQQSNGLAHDGAQTLPNVYGSPRMHQLTVTVTASAVLAVMGQQDFDLARSGLSELSETRMVCVDRTTGRQNWVAAASQFKQASLRTLQFTGSPLVVGKSVLLAACASKQAGIEDFYVLCFDLADGTVRWATNVASSSTVAMGMGAFNPNVTRPQNESHLAYANGRVYVQTNRGATAALDTYNGTIAWLDIYPRGRQAMANPAFNPMMFQGGGQFQENQTSPWTFNPVIISQGMVFTLPLEGKNLLIYDAASGEEVKRIDLNALARYVKNEGQSEELDPLTTLIGVSGDKLALAGSSGVVLLNWKTFDSEHFNDATMIFWIEPLPQMIRGRPLMTSESVYVPAEDRIYRMSLKSGLTREEYPGHTRGWDEGEGPGNVLVTSDHMIIAGADAVNVYTDLALAKKKLDREVAESPNDPQPRLRYAEVMYAAGDYDTCMKKIAEAVDLLGGIQSMQPGAGRDRVFSDAMTFAQRLGTDEQPEQRARIEKFFGWADSAAGLPEQRVQYLMARGRFDEQKGDSPAALALYQQVLADPTRRAVPLPDETTNLPASADAVARGRIADLIRKDPLVYDAVEKTAAAALQKARQSTDPAQLLEVAREYPNSSTAPQATLAAADAYEAAADLHAARHVLSDIYFDRDEKSADWPRILEAMARTDPRSAAHMLAQGVEELHDPKLTQPLKLTDGTEIAAGTLFSAALEKARKVSFQQQARLLPELRLPDPHHFKQYPKPFTPDGPVIANVQILVKPSARFVRPDRLVTWTVGTGLSIYAPGGNKPVRVAAFGEEPIGCAWLDKDLLVWGPTQASLFKADQSAPAWVADVGKFASIDVIATNPAPPDAQAGLAQRRINGRFIINRNGRIFIPNGVNAPFAVGAAAPKPVVQGPEQIVEAYPVGQRILLATSNGRVAAIDVQTGGLSWQTRLSDRAMDRVLADEDFTVIKAEDDADIRLAVLDTYTGHVRGIKVYQRDSNNFPQNLALSNDGTLVYTMPDRICLKDLFAPWDKKPIESAAAPGESSFAQMTQPDQLVIAEGRILALTDSGNGDRPGEKFIRIYSLETGEPVMLKVGDAPEMAKILSIGSRSQDIGLHVVGPRVYAIGPDAACCYNLESPNDHYQLFDQEHDSMSAQMSFLGSDYVVLISDGASPNPAPAAIPLAPAPAGAAAKPQPLSTTYSIYAFSRRLAHNGNEVGRLDYSTVVTDPAGITPNWQAMNGGLAYLSADHKLHMLMGAK